MIHVRYSFIVLCVLFLGLFWFACVGYMVDTGATASWFIWIFLVAPPLYGLTELFAYIVRIGGKSE